MPTRAESAADLATLKQAIVDADARGDTKRVQELLALHDKVAAAPTSEIPSGWFGRGLENTWNMLKETGQGALGSAAQTGAAIYRGLGIGSPEYQQHIKERFPIPQGAPGAAGAMVPQIAMAAAGGEAALAPVAGRAVASTAPLWQRAAATIARPAAAGAAGAAATPSPQTSGPMDYLNQINTGAAFGPVAAAVGAGVNKVGGAAADAVGDTARYLGILKREGVPVSNAQLAAARNSPWAVPMKKAEQLSSGSSISKLVLPKETDPTSSINNSVMRRAGATTDELTGKIEDTKLGQISDRLGEQYDIAYARTPGVSTPQFKTFQEQLATARAAADARFADVPAERTKRRRYSPRWTTRSSLGR